MICRFFCDPTSGRVDVEGKVRLWSGIFTVLNLLGQAYASSTPRPRYPHIIYRSTRSGAISAFRGSNRIISLVHPGEFSTETTKILAAIFTSSVKVFSNISAPEHPVYTFSRSTYMSRQHAKHASRNFRFRSYLRVWLYKNSFQREISARSRTEKTIISFHW